MAHSGKDIFDADTSSESDFSDSADEQAQSAVKRGKAAAGTPSQSTRSRVKAERNVSTETIGISATDSEPDNASVASHSVVPPLPKPALKRLSLDEPIAEPPKVRSKPAPECEIIDLCSDSDGPAVVDLLSSEADIPVPAVAPVRGGRDVQVTLDCIVPGYKGQTAVVMKSTERFGSLFNQYPKGTVFLANGVTLLSFSNPEAITDGQTLRVVAMTQHQYDTGEFLAGERKESRPEESMPEQPLFLSINCPDGTRISLRADANQPLRKVAEFARSQKNLAPDAEIVLSFDGDPLDLDDLLKDTEIEDEDVVDAKY